MILLTMMIPHRWVDPEFKDKEDASREVEGTVTGEEVAVELENKRKMVNNLMEEEEDFVVDIEMEELQPLRAKQ